MHLRDAQDHHHGSEQQPAATSRVSLVCQYQVRLHRVQQAVTLKLTIVRNRQTQLIRVK